MGVSIETRVALHVRTIRARQTDLVADAGLASMMRAALSWFSWKAPRFAVQPRIGGTNR